MDEFMTDYAAEFTHEEKARISEIYGNDLQNLEPGDISLISRWERAKALQDEDFKMKAEALKAEADEKARLARETAEEARAYVRELRDMAVARYEELSSHGI